MTSNNYILNEITIKTAKELARTYNVLLTSSQLKSVLQTILPNKDIEDRSKYDIHSLYNDIILRKYKSELLYKSLLVDYFINEDIIAAFEIKANGSRLDFLKINGNTISYEIKSEVDNLIKLQKQVSDYSLLFDYNYVVIGQNHLNSIKKLLPQNYGIFIVKNDHLFLIKKPIKNHNIDSNFQLNLFTKKELRLFFKTDDKLLIYKSFSFNEIQDKFRTMLKKRYNFKWEFLKKNKESILPVDYQYFYNHNISPNVIYERGN